LPGYSYYFQYAKTICFSNYYDYLVPCQSYIPEYFNQYDIPFPSFEEYTKPSYQPYYLVSKSTVVKITQDITKKVKKTEINKRKKAVKFVKQGIEQKKNFKLISKTKKKPVDITKVTQIKEKFQVKEAKDKLSEKKVKEPTAIKEIPDSEDKADNVVKKLTNTDGDGGSGG
jgi:hypothetical protein